MIDKLFTKEIAIAIIEAARIHESSWTPGKEQRLGEYRISFSGACEKVVESEKDRQLLYWLLRDHWNESLDLANAIIKEDSKP